MYAYGVIRYKEFEGHTQEKAEFLGNKIKVVTTNFHYNVLLFLFFLVSYFH